MEIGESLVKRSSEKIAAVGTCSFGWTMTNQLSGSATASSSSPTPWAKAFSPKTKKGTSAPSDSPIRISVRATEQNAMLSVTDEGSGISPELLPHIFDLFVQADKTRDRAKGGLGIGLTLVRQLVELHGGTIEATSDGVEGSTFTVRLPIAAAPTLRESDQPQVLARPKKRILLVDDHADALEMYTVVLQADGHEIFQAADGAAAIDLFKTVRPDAAIVDIGLPTMDGYEVAKAIRAEPNGRDVMLIALTGYGFPEDRERAKAAGFAFAYFYKRSRPMRQWIDKVSLGVPVIGPILRKAAIARFARTLATMFGAGVPLVEAMKSVAGATGNIMYQDAVLRMRDEIATGMRMQRAMENTGLFPNMVVQMIAVGEESGSLDEMAGKVADFYEADVDAAVDGLSSLLEPLIMVILGTLVGGLVIAMYLPIFKLGAVI